MDHPPTAGLTTTPDRSIDRFAPERLNHHVLGMWAFISSEVFFFGALIAVFISARSASTIPPGSAALDVPRTAIFTVFLLASSVTVTVAVNRLHAADRRGFQLWLVATVVLGSIFLAGQITEYWVLWQEGLTISQSIFFSAFYTLTGFHGLHVTCGLIALAVVTGLALAGDFNPHQDTAIETIALYWHFVDVVWIVVFAVVYLGGALG